MKKGDILYYFGEKCTVLDSNQTHVLIQFESGIKICTNKLTFARDESKRTN